MLGPRDLRPQYRGTWYPCSTNGFGIEELQFCEAARIEPAFAINIDETPEDAADLVEYLDGPGHLHLGREARGERPSKAVPCALDRDRQRGGPRRQPGLVSPLPGAVRAALRGHAAPRSQSELCDRGLVESGGALLQADCEALNGKAALWDVHVGGDQLREAEQVDRTLTQMQQLFAQWIPASDLRLYFEENGGRHDFPARSGPRAKLSHPAARCLRPMTARPTVSSRSARTTTAGTRGRSSFCRTAPGACRPSLPSRWLHAIIFRSACRATFGSPRTATWTLRRWRSDDGDITLKVVNSGPAAHQAVIRLDGFLPAPHADVWSLTAGLTAVNTADEPDRVRPTHATLDTAGAAFQYRFPPYSYTILRLRAR